MTERPEKPAAAARPSGPHPTAGEDAGGGVARSAGGAAAGADTVEIDNGEPDPVPLGIRLFLIPFMIVLACGLVLLIGRMLTTGPRSTWDYLQEVQTATGSQRWQAAYELSVHLGRRRGEIDPRVGAEMIRLFEESAGRAPRVRRYLALCLGRIADRRAVAALVGALGDGDPDTRVYSVWALGALGDSSAVAPLLDHVDDPDDGMRTVVAYSLGNLGTAAGIATLVDLLGDPVPDVRWNAATGLARQGHPGGRQVLTQMVDREALAALTTMPPAQQDEVVLNGIRAIRLLDEPGFDEILERLRRDDPNSSVRHAAADALAEP